MRRAVLMLFVLAFAAGAGACGSSGHKKAAPTTVSSATTTSVASTTTTTVAPTSAAPTTRPTATTAGGCAPPVGGSVTPQSSPTTPDVMLLTNVVASTHGCTDTIVFSLDSNDAQKPGYTVSYQAGPFTQDASGKPVSIAGSAFLVVKLDQASGFDFLKNRETYTGPTHFQPKGSAYVADVMETGDFEGVTTWVIGLRVQVPFTVIATGAPNHTLTVAMGEG